MKAGLAALQLGHAPRTAWAVQLVHPEPELDDLCSTRRQSQIAASRKYSAFGVPASAERSRPCSHSVADRPALGWL